MSSISAKATDHVVESDAQTYANGQYDDKYSTASADGTLTTPYVVGAATSDSYTYLDQDGPDHTYTDASAFRHDVYGYGHGPAVKATALAAEGEDVGIWARVRSKHEQSSKVDREHEKKSVHHHVKKFEDAKTGRRLRSKGEPMLGRF